LNDTQDFSAILRVVRLLTLAAFASSVAMRMCDPLLPKLADEFAVGLPVAAGVITGFAVAYGVLQLAIGPLADRIGKFLVVNIATLLAAVASIACALAPTLETLVIARVVAGGVGGAIIPVAFAWIGDEVPYERRQGVLAGVMSGGLLGLICGQLIGGFFADTIGWRAAFVALSVLFAAVAVMLRVSPAAKRAPSPPAGTVSLGPSCLLRGYAAIVSDRWARTVLAAVFVEGMLMYGAVSFVPSALHDRFAIPLWQAGGVSAVVGAGGFAYTLLAPRLIARLGERGLAGLGGALVALGLLGLAAAPSPWFALIASLALGLGFYAFHNTLQVHGTQLSSTHRTMGMALFALSLFVGQSIGVALASAVVAFAGFSETFSAAGVAFALLSVALVRALVRHHALPATRL
jgi:predicted MFS family arabinose efflux permease